MAAGRVGRDGMRRETDRPRFGTMMTDRINASSHISLSGIGGLGDQIMTSNVVENFRRAGWSVAVQRNGRHIGQLYRHDPRCRTVARSPNADEIPFHFNYWRYHKQTHRHHAAAPYLRNGVGHMFDYPECKLFVTEDEWRWAERTTGKSYYIAIASSTQRPTEGKNPSGVAWRDLLDAITDFPLVHTGQLECQYITPTLELGGKTNIREFMAIIACADLVIGADSAIIHMASAMGAPCIVLDTRNTPAEWFVYPSQKVFQPVTGVGKEAVFDAAKFHELVEFTFEDALRRNYRGKRRDEYTAPPKPEDTGGGTKWSEQRRVNRELQKELTEIEAGME